MYPYSSESCNTDSPCWQRREYRFPRNRQILREKKNTIMMCSFLKRTLFNKLDTRYKSLYLVRADYLASNTFLNVTELRLRYSGMQGRSVESAKIPKDAPDETDSASRVEYSPPSEMGNDERT